MGAQSQAAKPAPFTVKRLPILVAGFFLTANINSGVAYERPKEIVADPRGITFLLTEEGNVFGFESADELEKPIKLESLRNIRYLRPYMAIDKDGYLFTWQAEERNSHRYYSTAKKIDLPGKVKFVATGPFHSQIAVALEDGRVMQWRTREWRNPETGEILKPTSPELIIRLRDSPVSMAGSGSHTVILGSDGSITGWGANNAGQLGGDPRYTIHPDAPASFFAGKSAEQIGASEGFTIVRAAGVLLHWGGCSRDKIDTRSAALTGEPGDFSDVKDFSIGYGSKNTAPYLFTRESGGVWQGYAPRQSVFDKQCFEAEAGGRPRLFDGWNNGAISLSISGIIILLDNKKQIWSGPIGGPISNHIEFYK